jgi:hypothetical protein
MKANRLIARSVKQLEKELYRSTSLFDEVNQLTNSLKEIEAQAKQLEDLTEKDPAMSSVFQRELKDKAVIEKFKELQENLMVLRRELKKSEDPGFRTDIFLENYRTKNKYSFRSKDDSLAFLDRFFKETKQSHLFFGPRLLGIIDLNVLSRQFKVEKVSANYLKVPAKKLARMVNFLQENFKPVEYVIEAKESRFEFVDLRELNVKTSPERIRRLDALRKLY